MSFSDDSTLSYVVERDVDLILAQLIRSSPTFRRWLARRVDLDVPSDVLLGVRQSVFTENGESDLEVGFETRTGGSHVVLVENKIDASLQERQVERYYERGENYLDDGWDDFSVCLVAPENYVTPDEGRDFEAIVTYEEVMDEIESLDYDGSEFLSEVFERSLEKPTPADHSDLTAAIRRRVLSGVEEMHDVQVYQTSNTQVRLESTHDDHPTDLLYNAYVPGPHEGDRAIVRINLTGRNTHSDEDVAALRELLSEDLETPTGYERRDRPMDIVRKDVTRDEFDSREAYLESVAAQLSALIDFYHPRLVDADLRDASTGLP